jgi:asparagine synthase (glutamine-hydrolysing)
MSMAHGVEIRVPFLDKEFLKLVFSISSAVKYNGENDKQLLIDSFKTELSPQIWNRPKMGFSFPFAEWMADNAMIKDAFMQNDKRQKNNYENFTNGRLHWSQLMSLLLLNKHLYET